MAPATTGTEDEVPLIVSYVAARFASTHVDSSEMPGAEMSTVWSPRAELCVTTPQLPVIATVTMFANAKLAG